MKPLPLNALLQFLNRSHHTPATIQGFAIDSRLVKPGDLFFALPGKRVDGQQFLQEVASRGGRAAFVSENYRGDNYGLALIRTPDVLESLQTLAREVLRSRATQVVAITGSLGKTTTKEFASTLLKMRYQMAASPLSYNSQATLPLSILQSEEEEEVLVLEMGMSEPGNIEKLVAIAPPDIAVITTIAIQHANTFSDGLAGIAREKAAIFSHPKTRLGILHRDSHYFEEAAHTGKCPKQTFSMQIKESDYFLEAFEDRVHISLKNKTLIEIPFSLPIRVHYQNFLASIAIARALDVPWEAICEASLHLKLPPMRFEKLEKQGIVFINDAFNANPDSMKAALESLPRPKEGGKTIAVLGEMNALGMYSESGHATVAECALQSVDMLFCIGQRCEAMLRIWKREKRPAELCETKEELERKLKEVVRAGDVVLVKGARAFALEHILKGFD